MIDLDDFDEMDGDFYYLPVGVPLSAPTGVWFFFNIRLPSHLVNLMGMYVCAPRGRPVGAGGYLCMWLADGRELQRPSGYACMCTLLQARGIILDGRYSGGCLWIQ